MDPVAAVFIHPSVVLRLSEQTAASAPDERIMTDPRLTIGDVEIDLNERRVWQGGEPVEFSPTEFRVLALLLVNANQTMTREQIIFGVHHEELVSTPRAIDYHIFALRKKLGAAAECLKTVRGIGYRFELPASPAP
jgi:DNA-binding response OmpR family regulator